MTLVASANDYVHQLLGLGTALEKLRQMVDVDDADSPHLVEEIHAETLAVIGLQVGSLESAQKILALLEEQNNLEQIWRSLTTSSQSFVKMSARFYENLFVAHHIIDLERLKRKQDGEWAMITQSDLHSCQIEMQQAYAALLSCWQTYSETLGAKAPSLHSTSVAQQFMFLEKK